MTKTVTLEIDGKSVEVPEGTTVLAAAQKLGIDIPTLCHHNQLKPHGSCRLCMVEMQKGSRKKLVASCAYPAENGIRITTSTPKIEKHRKLIVELLWPSTMHLAARCGVTRSRFEGDTPDCNLCGLCVRYCREVVGKDVLYFKGRGVDRKVDFVPGMATECASCRKCFSLCSGGFVVTHHGTACMEC